MSFLLAANPLSPQIDRFGWLLLHSLWQFTLMALFASITLRALRQRSSTLRYNTLVGILALSVVAPVVTWLVLPETITEIVSSTPTSDVSHAVPIESETLASVLDPVVGPSVPMGAVAKLREEARRVTDSRLASTGPQQSAFTLERFSTAIRPWLTWIVGAWCIGVVLCSARPLLGWRTLRRLRSVGVSPVHENVLSALRRISNQLGLRRVVTVLQSTLAQSPVVIGYLRPVILLPASLLTSIPPAQLEAILAHELAHVRRHDFLVNVLQAAIETLFFYHPAVWWLSNRIRIEREHCCDDLVIALLDNRAEYGRALLAIEEFVGLNSVLAIGATDGSLLARVRRIVGAHPRHTRRLSERWPAALLSLTVIGATCWMAMTWKLEARDVSNEKPEPVVEDKPKDDPPAADQTPPAKTGAISGRIQVSGPIPQIPPNPVPMRRSSEVVPIQTEKIPNETLVLSKQGGLANAFVYLKKSPIGSGPHAAPNDPMILTNEKLRFAPHASLIRTGQTLVLKNVDVEPQNFHAMTLRNSPYNILVASDGEVTWDQHRHPENLPYRISSDIQPWKQPVYLLCLDHPFAAVTDSEGRFEIPGLPPGEHDFTVWHERVGYLEKKLTVAVKAGETTKVPNLQVDIARFKVGELPGDALTVQWIDSGKGWSAGIGWAAGTTEFTWNRPDHKNDVVFELSLRNDTDQPLTVTVPESFNWDFGMEAERTLNVRIHDRGKTMVTLAAHEIRVLDVPSPKLNLDGIEPGFWYVKFSTPFSETYHHLQMWLDAPLPQWRQTVTPNPETNAQNILWGRSLQGLRFGMRLSSDSRQQLPIKWSKTSSVTLKPEFFVWNTTTAEVEISMLQHMSLDWVHRITGNMDSQMRAQREFGPHPILTGPKVEEKHRLKPNEVLRLGESILQILPADSAAHLNDHSARLKPGHYGYWSFLNLHRTDQPHISLHLKTDPQTLKVEAE